MEARRATPGVPLRLGDPYSCLLPPREHHTLIPCSLRLALLSLPSLLTYGTRKKYTHPQGLSHAWAPLTNLSVSFQGRRHLTSSQTCV